MCLTELLGVLGFLLAVVSLSWQVLSQRARLRVEVDATKSELVPGWIVRDAEGKREREEEPCTIICLVVSVSNPSKRPNTVVRIDVAKPASRHTLSVDGRTVFTRDPSARSDRQELPEWMCPQFIPPGDRHEAWAFHVAENGVWNSDIPMAIKVCAVDTHGRKHWGRATLRDPPPANP